MAKVRKINWDKVTEKIKNLENKSSFNKDDKISENTFVPKMRDDGTFQAVVRFVPRPENDGDGVPFVKLMNHGFKDINGWFIENCPTTIGKPCPVCQENGKEWNAGNEKLASERGRRTSYYTNMLVVNDPQSPDNNGKVFIFRYGKKIHEKIMEKMAPSDESIDQPVPVFDYKEGENFKLKIRLTKSVINGKDVTFKNYDQSTFTGTATALEDEEIEKIESLLFELEELVSPSAFKSFDELDRKFKEKTGKISNSYQAQSNSFEDDDSSDEDEGDGSGDESIESVLAKIRDDD